MNILFLTLLNFDSIRKHNIYTDLLRQFVEAGHTIYAVSPIEEISGKHTLMIQEKNTTILRVPIPNMQKTNRVKKGISMFAIQFLFKKAICKHFSTVKFDLILYSTPPITLAGATVVHNIQIPGTYVGVPAKLRMKTVV